MKADALSAIVAAQDAFARISDPDLALDLAVILFAEILEGASPEYRVEVARHITLQSLMLLEHLKK